MQHTERSFDSSPLVAEMKRRSLTNEKLAVKAGIVSRTVSDVRAGKETLQIQTLRKAAGALDMEVVIRFRRKRAARNAAST